MGFRISTSLRSPFNMSQVADPEEGDQKHHWGDPDEEKINFISIVRTDLVFQTSESFEKNSIYMIAVCSNSWAIAKSQICK